MKPAADAMTSPIQPTNLYRDYGTERPGLFERSGLHAMRKVAITWCRAHPVEAAALPAWNLELLASVLEGVA